MKINGTLINYYFHCKRQCYLCGNRINLEDNSEDVAIGKVLHEIKHDSENTEIKIDNIFVDKITEKYVIEMKKSDADVEASKMQLLYYLKVLKEKGIERDGKLVFLEKNKTEKVDIIKLDENILNLIENCEQEILKLLENNVVPPIEKTKGCKRCAYYEYCYL